MERPVSKFQKNMWRCPLLPRGQKPRPQFVLPIYNFYKAAMTIKGGIILLLAIFGLKYLSLFLVPKSTFGDKNKGLNIIFDFLTPKGHTLARNDVFWTIPQKIH